LLLHCMFILLQYYAESHALIYIVDSSDRDRIPDSKEAFGMPFFFNFMYIFIFCYSNLWDVHYIEPKVYSSFLLRYFSWPPCQDRTFPLYYYCCCYVITVCQNYHVAMFERVGEVQNSLCTVQVDRNSGRTSR
jgi:hypothetical protein